MALKIRMRLQGRSNRPFYRLVVIDSKTRRDGKYMECIGWYNPCEKDEDKILNLNSERLQHWLDNGAELSERVENLVCKGAPAVIKSYKEKIRARKSKETAKRRERRREAAKA